MNLFHKQKNKWQTFVRERRYNLAFFSLSPSGDWRIMIRIFTILLLVTGVIGYWFSRETIKSIYYNSADNSIGEARLVDLEKVDQVINSFENRRTNFEAGSVETN